jgi:flavin-binding protein dodecin
MEDAVSKAPTPTAHGAEYYVVCVRRASDGVEGWESWFPRSRATREVRRSWFFRPREVEVHVREDEATVKAAREAAISRARELVDDPQWQDVWVKFRVVDGGGGYSINRELWRNGRWT